MKQKLKVGDRVKVISNGDCYNNQIGIIVNINPSKISRYKYDVKFDVNFNDTNFIGIFEESELQLLPQSKWKYGRKRIIEEVDKAPIHSSPINLIEYKKLVYKIVPMLLAKQDQPEKSQRKIEVIKNPGHTWTFEHSPKKIKPIEKLKKHMEFSGNSPQICYKVEPNTHEIWQKQCEIIDHINNLESK